ncbi:hypothetical protein [Longispora albida]|uniref:hypothetical protein n=1 Tax=Longispora albida TaxID=203523 RepID=UPI00036FF015|nr:hypothetical protein [Longispora albida]
MDLARDVVIDQPPHLKTVTGIVGRPNVIRNADFILVIGGAGGTLHEVELGLAAGMSVLPFPASGGTARTAYEVMAGRPESRAWLSEDEFLALGRCATAEEYTSVVDRLLTRSK